MIYRKLAFLSALLFLWAGCEQAEPTPVGMRPQQSVGKPPAPAADETAFADLAPLAPAPGEPLVENAASPPKSPLPESPWLPRRLRLLKEHLSTSDRFLDFEFGRAGSLESLFGDEHLQPIRDIGGRFRVFAGDGTGGLLALDGANCNSIEEAAIVHFSSEGGICVLGESADDFLALIAATNKDWLDFHYAEADEELRQWIAQSGIKPHRSAGERMAELGDANRDFLVDFWSAMRQAARRRQPKRVLDHTLIFGQQLGEARLGMPREQLDQRWGEPNVPQWGRDTDHYLAIYSGASAAIEFDNQTERVTRITLYPGIHQAVGKDGVSLTFLPQAQALAWLQSHGIAAELLADEIRAPTARLRLFLQNADHHPQTPKWVTSVELGTP